MGRLLISAGLPLADRSGVPMEPSPNGLLDSSVRLEVVATPDPLW